MQSYSNFFQELVILRGNIQPESIHGDSRSTAHELQNSGTHLVVETQNALPEIVHHLEITDNHSIYEAVRLIQ